MERRARIARLVEHAKNPLHRRVLEEADIVMPGGSPECGGTVTVYLRGDGNGGIDALSFTGEGDTISQGATDIVLEGVLARGLSMEEVLALDYDELVESLGREIIGSRTRNATLGLSALKNAVRRHQRGQRAGSRPSGEAAV